MYDKIDDRYKDNIQQQLNIADENRDKATESRELSSYLGKSHPQYCYINQGIYTLYGLHNSLENKSEKSQGIFFLLWFILHY